MAVCRLCKEELPEQEPGYVTFHMCRGPRHRTNGVWNLENEMIARRWVEAHTEYDFEELPVSLQDKLKALSTELLQFTNNNSIMGEVITDRETIEAVVKEFKELE